MQVLFLFGVPVNSRDSNPERAFCVKKNMPGAYFLTKWCAARYRSLQGLGGQAGNLRSRFVPDGAPEKAFTKVSAFLFYSTNFQVPISVRVPLRFLAGTLGYKTIHRIVLFTPRLMVHQIKKVSAFAGTFFIWCTCQFKGLEP